MYSYFDLFINPSGKNSIVLWSSPVCLASNEIYPADHIAEQLDFICMNAIQMIDRRQQIIDIHADVLRQIKKRLSLLKTTLKRQSHD
jgi:hypothetical protein